MSKILEVGDIFYSVSRRSNKVCYRHVIVKTTTNIAYREKNWGDRLLRETKFQRETKGFRLVPKWSELLVTHYFSLPTPELNKQWEQSK